MKRTLGFGVVALVCVVACEGDDDESAADAGSSPDAAAVPDGGAGADAAGVADAGLPDAMPLTSSCDLPAAGARPALEVVLVSGTTAPGTDSTLDFGVNISGLPAVNDAGDVALDADLVGGTSPGLAIVRVNAGGLALLARDGDPAPGVAGGQLGSPDLSSVAPSGVALYTSSIDGVPAGTNAGVWLGSQLVARSGEAVAGGRFMSGTVSATLRPAGAPLLRAVTYHPDTPELSAEGVLEYRDGVGLVAFAQQGDAAGGTTGGVFSQVVMVRQRVAGTVAFVANLQEGVGDATFDNSIGIWTATDAGTNLIARKGQDAPGTDVELDYFLSMDISASGDVVFHAGVRDGTGTVTFNDDTGIWLHRDGVTEKLLRENEPMFCGDRVSAGMLDGAEDVSMSANGTLGLGLYTRAAPGMPPVAQGRQIYLWKDGAHRLLAEIGTPAPGGGTFSGLAVPVVNDAGQAVFGGQAYDGGVTHAQGIWGVSSAGTVHLIAKVGDTVDVAGDGSDVRTIEWVDYNVTIPSGSPSNPGGGLRGPEGDIAFNASGTVVMVVEFTDDSHAILRAQLD